MLGDNSKVQAWRDLNAHPKLGLRPRLLQALFFMSGTSVECFLRSYSFSCLAEQPGSRPHGLSWTEQTWLLLRAVFSHHPQALQLPRCLHFTGNIALTAAFYKVLASPWGSLTHAQMLERESTLSQINKKDQREIFRKTTGISHGTRIGSLS